MGASSTWCIAAFRGGCDRKLSCGSDLSFFTLYRYVDASDIDKFPSALCEESTGALTLAGAGDAQAFAIFGDGAAGNLDTFAMKFLGDGLVG